MGTATIEIEFYDFVKDGKTRKGLRCGRWIAEERMDSCYIVKLWSNNVGESVVFAFDPMCEGVVYITARRAMEIILCKACEDEIITDNA